MGKSRGEEKKSVSTNQKCPKRSPRRSEASLTPLQQTSTVPFPVSLTGRSGFSLSLYLLLLQPLKCPSAHTGLATCRLLPLSSLSVSHLARSVPMSTSLCVSHFQNPKERGFNWVHMVPYGASLPGRTVATGHCPENLKTAALEPAHGHGPVVCGKLI